MANRTVLMGPFLDATDAVTIEDALVIAKASVLLSKDGGELAAASASQGAADAGAPYDANGYYQITLNDTDWTFTRDLLISINIAGALPVERLISVATGGLSGID